MSQADGKKFENVTTKYDPTKRICREVVELFYSK